MNAVSPRRSRLSLLLGVLAMGGSFAALGVVVLSDVAAAQTVESPTPQQAAPASPEQKVTPPPPRPPGAKTPKKVYRKPSKKVDFGRFEGY